MRFWKVQGIGNDFVLLDLRPDATEPSPPLARRLCDRRLGVGADGLLAILPPRGEGDVRMAFLNADGSRAEMCGNGIRCLVRHLWEGDSSKREWTVETDAGVRPCRVHLGPDGRFAEVEAEMGPAVLEGEVEAPLEVEGVSLRTTRVRIGNPHVVTFDALAAEARRKLGPLLEAHPDFEGRRNVEFASVREPGHLAVSVWERGVGFTRACGTGACAAAAVACASGRSKFDAPVRVSLPGGELVVTVPRDLARIRMRGPAARVFEGTIDSG